MTNLPVRIASILALSAGLALAPAAFAQPTDREIAAEALFQEGKQLFEASKFPEAAEKFAASFKLDPAWGPLFNLAHCHQQLGKTATAWAEFREAVSIASATGRKERAEAANERAKALEPSLVRLQITVDDKTPGLSVTRNGAAADAATWGAALPVDPGAYTVEASAPGKVVWRTTVRAEAPGQTIAVRVPVLQEPVPPPAPELPPSFWQQHRGSMATLGVGVGLAAVGGVLAGLAVAGHRTLSDECVGGKPCAALDSVRAKVIAADVMFGAAGVAAVTSLVVFLVAERRSAPAAVAPATAMPLGIAVTF